MENNQTMKASELRVQNLIQHKDNIITVKGISPHCNDYAINTDNEWVYLKNCLPIPLTEEWLLRMGFEFKRQKVGANGIFSKGELNLTLSYGGIVYRKLNRPVLYVHQLQNLYFALTNQELEIKES